MASEVRPPISVALIEDHRRVRDGLAALIDGTPSFRCTGAFESVEMAWERIGQDLPDVLLLDIGLPGMSGIEGLRRLKDRYPQLQVVILTVYEEDKRIFDALCAGACGYLLKNTAPARLLECLREVKAGGSPMSPEVARRVIRLFQQFRPSQQSDYNLTPNEIRIVKLLAEGHNYETAAHELRISVNTIRFYVRSIYSKLQVHSKSEAVAKALREGVIH